MTSRGTVTLIPPTRVIREPCETHRRRRRRDRVPARPGDGSARRDAHVLSGASRALNLAENATHNLHNTYPIRGAQVRDANAWAKYLDEALDRFAHGADVVFAQHHWPVWGGARARDFLAKQRDLYKFLHDQTVRLMNHGWKAPEIAERLVLPAEPRRAPGTCAATTAP